MRTQWPIAQLSEVCHFQNGYAFKNSDYVEEGHGAFEVFRMGNIRKGGGFNPDGKKALVHAKHAATLRRFLLNQGDILMCMTDMKANVALLGHTARMPVSGRYLVNQRVGRITVSKPEVLDQHFLYYYSNSPGYIDWLRSHANSGVQVNLSTEAILNSPIACPPLPIQRRIAGILSAYDELIENSQRRIKILEAMARALYREWFVHFRFPGHESVPRVPSPLGDIPQGWEVRKVAEFAEFTRGFEPGSNAYEKEPSIDRVRFLRVGDLSKRDSGLYIAAQLAEGRVLGPLDIAITLDGSVGEVRLGLDGAYSSGIRRVDVKDNSRLGWVFAYQLLLSDSSQATIQSHAKGTTIKHAGSAVGALTFVSPPRQLVELFESNAAPMIRSALGLQQQVENLRRTRDLLLPRLLSGQIDVEAMPS